MSQDPYGRTPAQHQPPYSRYQLDQRQEGAKAAMRSLAFGITGILVWGLGFVFGPLAIIFAHKAERLGVPATPGKVLGWVVTVLTAVVVIAIILLLAVGAARSGY
jgi:uncharacterized Tic20 family protein